MTLRNRQTRRNKDEPSWFQQIPFGVKLLFGIMIVAIGVLIYWQIQKAVRHQDACITSCESNGLFPLNQPSSSIHVLIHLYRASPDIVAKTMFAAFEGAKFPGFVHVHLFQELCVKDGYPKDAFDLYKRHYAGLHSWNTAVQNMFNNIHVVNENPSQSAGRVVSWLTLTQESVLPIMQSNDIIVIPQSFYDAPGTDHLFPVTFSNHYDQTLRHGQIQSNTIYSGRLPRTSLSASSAAQVTTLTSSLTHAIGNNLIIPFFKSKEHHKYLECKTTGVCSKSSGTALYLDQCGFTSFTTSDRVHASGVRHTTSSDVPFTLYQMMRDFYAPSTQSDTKNWASFSKQYENELTQPLPIVGVHEDIIVCDGQTWSKLVHFSHASGRHFLVPGPEYTQSLMLSNLIYSAGMFMETMNHLPVAVVFDHLTGTAATSDRPALNRVKQFEPHNWLVEMQQLNELCTTLTPVELSDPCDRIKLHSQYEWYAGVSPDNVTENAFLGITGHDTPAVLTRKFSSMTEVERQKRMLAAIQYPSQGTY